MIIKGKGQKVVKEWLGKLSLDFPISGGEGHQIPWVLDRIGLVLGIAWELSSDPCLIASIEAKLRSSIEEKPWLGGAVFSNMRGPCRYEASGHGEIWWTWQQMASWTLWRSFAE